MNQKYEISEIAHPQYPWLHRIRALSDVRPDVPKGHLGGYVQCEENLSQKGACWIADDAVVCDNARVYGSAWIGNKSHISGQAVISGDAHVGGNAEVLENCALPGFVDSKNEEKTERNAGYLVVSHSGGGMLRQGTRKGIRRTPANRGMRAHRIVKSLDISEDVCHGLCP